MIHFVKLSTYTLEGDHYISREYLLRTLLYKIKQKSKWSVEHGGTLYGV